MGSLLKRLEATWKFAREDFGAPASVAIVVAAIALVLLLHLGAAWVFALAWNYTLVPLFGAPALGAFRALAMLFVVGLIGSLLRRGSDNG